MQVGEPIILFKSKEQLAEITKEWQSRLFLGDWIIESYFVNPHEMSNPNFAGESDVQWVNKMGTIKLLHPDIMPNNGLSKQPQEQILVHELLHFKFFGVEQMNATIEGVFWDTMQHQLLEELARSLIMAKYNIKNEWFKNVK